MNNYISDNIYNFLIEDIGLSNSSINLGIKLSIRNKTSLPIALWSHGLINSEELDRFYYYVWR